MCSQCTRVEGSGPHKKVIQSCAAGAPGSKGMVPIRRVNRSCTTKWEGEHEEPILLGLPSRPESRCSERDTVKRIRMPSDAPEIGARRDRNRCAEMKVFPSPHGFWAWQDRRDGNRVADFIPPWHDCCDWSPIVAVTFEQSDLVSSLFYNPIHLFSPHPDLAVTDLLRWKGTTLLYQVKSSWETQEQALRAPRGSDQAPVPPGAIVTATILPESPFTNTPLLPAPDHTATPCTSSSLGDMDLRTSVLLMGLVITSSANPVHRSATLGSLMGLLSVVPADRFTLRNGYGTVGSPVPSYSLRLLPTLPRCRLIAAFRPAIAAPGLPLSRKIDPHGSSSYKRKEKGYINAYVCSLFRTDIRYNCGVYGHPELDPMHWSFLIPQRVTVEQCLEWLRTRTYRLAYHSTMMHGKEFTQPVLVNEPNYITYLVYGRTFLQAPALPTDQVTDIACQGEWYEYQADKPHRGLLR